MALRTYGDKPISFQIEEGGEFYCVGSEVGGIHFVYYLMLVISYKFIELINKAFDFAWAEAKCGIILLSQ